MTTLGRVPNHEQAVVPRAKIVSYLLSSTHRDGRSKARFFTRFGFTARAWRVLAAALLRHVTEHPATRIDQTPFGTRYVIEGILWAPDGRTPTIRSIWFIERGGETPRFVTAYPIRRTRNDQGTR